jgi:hypothetical protein
MTDPTVARGWSFEDFRRANIHRAVSKLDYANNVLRGDITHADGVLAIGALFWPEFRVIDGLVFVDALFTDEKLANLRADGCADQEVEYWMNLFSVDGFFDNLPGESPFHIDAVAEMVCSSWAAKAAAEFRNNNLVSHILRDGDTGDVLVTISRRV